MSRAPLLDEHSDRHEPTAITAPGDEEPVESGPIAARVAILGNLNVGKTTLFDSLCPDGGHPVHLPGRREVVNRGVSAIHLGRAARRVRRQCARCSHSGTASGPHGQGVSLRCERSTDRDHCPALRGQQSPCAEVHRSRDCCPSCGAAQRPTLSEITHLFDTPGSATLVATHEDEMIARDLLLSGEMNAVLLVADAKNLRRSLAFALEVAELGLPMLIDLNMVDEAESLGIDIDDGALAKLLGVPVVRSVAVEDAGTQRLAEQLAYAREPLRLTRFPAAIEASLSRLEDLLAGASKHDLSPRGLGLLCLAGDEGATQWVSQRLPAETLSAVQQGVEHAQQQFRTPLDLLLQDAFHREAGRLVERVATSTPERPSLLAKFGSIAQRPFPGLLIALGVLVLAYEWIGAFGATYVVDNLSNHLFHGLLIPWCEQLVSHVPSAFIRDAIMDPDFGLLPTGLFLAVGIVLPVLFCFYLMQAVLEDSGYLARLSVLFNRVLQWLGLNGQALIPLVLGFSCITMAIITTRMLPTKKERLLLSLLLISGIPCAPLLAVMLVILGKMSWTASLFLAGFLGLQFLIVGLVASRVLPGELPSLVLEIPRMRVPRPRILLIKTWRRTMEFMREAVPIFLIASFAVFLFDRVGGLVVLESAARPLVNDLLGLPDVAVQVFVKTIIRRENGATELSHLREQFDPAQLVITMLVMTVLLPCVNASIVMIKERGLKTAVIILGMVMTYAVLAGTAAHSLCRALGLTFT